MTFKHNSVLTNGSGTVKNINEIYKRETRRPVKIAQFGQGNFLRAFADWMIDIANEKGVFNGDIAVIKPTESGSLRDFDEQDNLYTVRLRGKENGKIVDESRVVSCIAQTMKCTENRADFLALAGCETLRFVISNTTEAGITLDESDTPENLQTFPAKLTMLLYQRFLAFGGAADKGLIILPTELIENNGGTDRKSTRLNSSH